MFYLGCCLFVIDTVLSMLLLLVILLLLLLFACHCPCCYEKLSLNVIVIVVVIVMVVIVVLVVVTVIDFLVLCCWSALKKATQADKMRSATMKTLLKNNSLRCGFIQLRRP